MVKPVVIETLEDLGFNVYHTGSRAIMENPRPESDDDWLVQSYPGLTAILEKYDFTPMGGDNTSGGPNTVPWYNAEKTINIIVCYSRETFNRWKDATDEAKRLKLDKREDRVALFKRYRVDEADEEIPF